MKNSSAGRALLQKGYPPSDHASSQYRSGPSQGGSDSRRCDFDVVVTDAIMAVCRAESTAVVRGAEFAKVEPKPPASVDLLIKLVACEMVGFFIIIGKTCPLYRLIAPRVKQLIDAGVIVERDGGIVVGQEGRHG